MESASGIPCGSSVAERFAVAQHAVDLRVLAIAHQIYHYTMFSSRVCICSNMRYKDTVALLDSAFFVAIVAVSELL